MVVDTGLVAAFEDTVDMNIERIKGVRNVMFGGEGLFDTTLIGPGKIYLQSMSMANIADLLAPYFRQDSNNN